MAQPSIDRYYSSRKRKAIDDFKVDSAPKKLQLEEPTKTVDNTVVHPTMKSLAQLLKTEVTKESPNPVERHVPKKVVRQLNMDKPSGRKTPDIQSFLNNMKKDITSNPQPKPVEKKTNDLSEIKKKLTKSDKLAELKASIVRFKKSEEQLKAAEKKTEEILQSPKLKTFKSIDFEVEISPSKTLSPEKLYLSPKKDSSARRNLFTASSPSKYDSTRDTGDSPTLQLPFKYRTLNEIFRAIDTVSQILYNRKELITFNKLKSAVEKMLKRNFLQKYLAQIKSVYPNAYKYTIEKLKAFGMGFQIQWELVITPILNSETMTTQLLLDRRRKLHQVLIDKIKDYHNEFLMSLTPPMVIPKDKITNWHPEFDIERVPDVELAELPQIPSNEKCATGKEVLENARKLFNCNTRMNQALQNLKEMKEKASGTEETNVEPPSIIKGIPQALLEKVRQKQAAKALLSMTRTVDKEKQLQIYSRLPEIARLTRNLFVTEKKSVLELDVVVEKLGNSYRSFLNKKEIEDHLKIISEKVAGGWLVFHKLRNSMYLKLDKNADLSLVLNKLEKLIKEEKES